jgi:hypothetical protein
MSSTKIVTELEKQSGETRSFTMDFSNLMTSAETISSVDSSTQKYLNGDTSTDLTISSVAISGQTVTFNVAGGTNGKRYRIEHTITTSLSQILIGDGILRICNE